MATGVAEAVAPAGLSPPASPIDVVADEVLQLPPGLVNLGNSCYMNSVLQTLASSQRFCSYLRNWTRAVEYGKKRSSSGPPLAQRPVGHSWSTQQYRRGGVTRSPASVSLTAAAATAADGGCTDPRVAGLATTAVEALEGAVDMAASVAAPLLQALVRALCRAALWLQGWEPPSPSMVQQQQQQAQGDKQPPQQLALSPLAAAACAPLHAAIITRRGCAAPLPPAAAVALQSLAAATLLLRLDAVLRSLQPSYSRAVGSSGDVATAALPPPPIAQRCRTGPVDPSALLAALRDQLPGSSLRLGQQNDAAEALACLCDCLDAEMAAWYLLYGRWIQASPLEQLVAAPAAAWDAVATAAGAEAAVVEPPHPANDVAPSEAMAPTRGSVADGGGGGSGGASPAASRLFRSGAAAAGLPLRPPACPLRGLLTSTSTCCECGGTSVSHVEPFWSLQLPLPPPQPPPAMTGSLRPPPPPSAPPLPPLRPRRHAPRLSAAGGALEALGAGAPRQPLLPSLDPEAEACRRPPPPPQEQQRQPEGVPHQPRAPGYPPGLAPAPSSGGGRTGLASCGGLTLRDCLAQSVQLEAVEGVECCRCSLQVAQRRVRRATGAAKKVAANPAAGQQQPPPPQQQPQQQQQQQQQPAVPRLAEHSVAPLPAPGWGLSGPGSDVRTNQPVGLGLVPCNESGCRHRQACDNGGGDGVCGEPNGYGCCCEARADTADGRCSSGSTVCCRRELGDKAEEAMEATGAAGARTAAAAAEAAVPEDPAAVAAVAEACWGERHLARLEALLSGPHLPELDLDLELHQLQQILLQLSPMRSPMPQQEPQGAAAAAAAALPAVPGTTASVAAAPLEAVRARALRRTRVARCPPVLVLQLLRTVWDPRVGAAVKDGRHVAFPTVLGPGELELLGVTLPELPSPPEYAEAEAEAGEVAPTPGPRVLTAVVVHYGGADSGHYLMYRRIATAMLARDGSGSGSGVGGGNNSAWLRVSDSSVALADEREVLQQAAAVLMYEQQKGLQGAVSSSAGS